MSWFSNFWKSKNSTSMDLSGLDKDDLASMFDRIGRKEAFFGLDNFGATCYMNSVVQALYACKRFRMKLLAYHEERIKNSTTDKELLIDNLAALFSQLNGKPEKPTEDKWDGDGGEPGETGGLDENLSDDEEQETGEPKWTGSIKPTAMMKISQKKNCMFVPNEHQDAQEYALFLLDTLTQEVKAQQLERELKRVEEEKKEQQGADEPEPEDSSSSEDLLYEETSCDEEEEKRRRHISNASTEDDDWFSAIFAGTSSSETTCVWCETTTTRDEPFKNICCPVIQQGSIGECLKLYSKPELLEGQNKYACDGCLGKRQEAFKRLRIKKSPEVLILALKRFEYDPRIQNFKKLFHSVAFSQEFKIAGTVEPEDADQPYSLFAVVIHIGSSGRMGHYICLVKRCGAWFLMDDENIKVITEDVITSKFGNCKDTAYLLFYEKKDGLETEDTPHRKVMRPTDVDAGETEPGEGMDTDEKGDPFARGRNLKVDGVGFGGPPLPDGAGQGILEDLAMNGPSPVTGPGDVESVD